MAATTRVRDDRWQRQAPAVLAGLVVVGAVLRLTSLGHSHLSFDESVSAVVARLPLADIPGHLRGHDPHPPLSYLLLHPLAAHGVSEGWLRLLAAGAGTGALVVFARWQRRLGVTGLIATGLLAVGPFTIFYARQARMYGPLLLAGVVAAWAAHRWLLDGGRRPVGWAAVATLTALLLHGSGVVLAAGLLTVAGVRRDRDAWRWRGGIGVAVAGWLVLWGPSLVDQAGRGGARYIPFTSLDSLTITLNELVAPVPANRWLALGLVAAGGFVLARTDRVMFRVWACCFLVPVGLGAAIGLRVHFFGPKALVVASWAPAVALAAVVVAAARRHALAGAATGALVALLLLPSVAPARHWDENAGRMTSAVAAVAQEGDAVATSPAFLHTLTDWSLGVRRRGSERHVVVAGLAVPAMVLGDGPPTGRVWLVEGESVAPLVTSLPSCGEPRSVGGGYRLRCLDAPPAAFGRP